MYFALLKVTQLRTIYEKSLITEQYTELNAYLEKKTFAGHNVCDGMTKNSI